MVGKSRALQELEEAQALLTAETNGRRQIAFRPLFAARCRDFALLGLAEEEMADQIGVSHDTFMQWKVDHPSLAIALKRGGKEADSRVAAAQHRRAVGMTIKKQKALIVDGQVQVVEIKEELAPSESAGQHWLSNRHRSKWKSANAGDVTATLDIDAMASELEARRAARLQALRGEQAKPVEPLDVETKP